MAPDERRASAFARWFDRQLGARVERWRWGSVIVHDGPPSSADFNFVKLEDPAVEGSDLFHEIERARRDAGIAARPRVVIDDADLANRLTPSFERVGWHVERFHLMVQRRPSVVRPDAPPAAEVTLERFLGFRGLVAAEVGEANDEWTVAEAIDRAIGTRCFVASIDGRPVAGCVVWANGQDAQVDTVETLPSARGRGAASSVVGAATTAARDAGATWIHLYTRADRGPARLYERLGFDVVGAVTDIVGSTGGPSA